MHRRSRIFDEKYVSRLKPQVSLWHPSRNCEDHVRSLVAVVTPDLSSVCVVATSILAKAEKNSSFFFFSECRVLALEVSGQREVAGFGDF